VNEFVLAHGGTVEVVDGEFPGAHFRLRLPAAEQAQAEVPVS
jgi:signal transduction histidine kinase